MLTCVGVRNWRSNFTSLRRRQNIGSCRVDESPVASDVSYGGKEVVQVTDALYNYILDHTREPDVSIVPDCWSAKGQKLLRCSRASTRLSF